MTSAPGSPARIPIRALTLHRYSISTTTSLAGDKTGSEKQVTTDARDAFSHGNAVIPRDPIGERTSRTPKFRTEVSGACGTRVESLTLPSAARRESERERTERIAQSRGTVTFSSARAMLLPTKPIVVQSLCLLNLAAFRTCLRDSLAHFVRGGGKARLGDGLGDRRISIERRGIHKWTDKREECILSGRRRECRGARYPRV